MLEEEIKLLRLAIENLINVLKNSPTLAIDANKNKISGLIPVSKWNNYYDNPTIPALRYIIFNEKTNGASIFLHRVGRKIYINQEAFWKWVESNPKMGI